MQSSKWNFHNLHAESLKTLSLKDYQYKKWPSTSASEAGIYMEPRRRYTLETEPDNGEISGPSYFCKHLVLITTLSCLILVFHNETVIRFRGKNVFLAETVSSIAEGLRLPTHQSASSPHPPGKKKMTLTSKGSSVAQ